MTYGPAHAAARAELLADRPTCVHCRVRPATVADHVPPLSMWNDTHPGEPWNGHYVPSCRPCSDRQGARVRGSRSRGHRNSRDWLA